ncbi:MAG TPA: septum site-determining protein MinC [Ktedonobacteraceae bacterium]|nr:septum site-determining protein MinC [Ktedonobacteraceae bacterium]
MAMEDASGQQPAEQQSGLEKEERQSVQGSIAIKGTRNGLLLTLEPGTPFSDLLTALSERLSEAPGFFRGASLSVDTTRRALEISERTQLEALLAYYQMSVATPEPPLVFQSEPLALPASVSTELRELSETPDTLALDQPAPNGNGQEARDARESDDTLFLRRTVRSGQAIHHHSSVVVLGDVNPGAEIVAGGDIIVWGVLRGMVHAGYPANEQALVCSLALAPVQLRIAHLLSRPPEGFEAQPRPEVAAIRDGQIVVEAWINGRPPRK